MKNTMTNKVGVFLCHPHPLFLRYCILKSYFCHSLFYIVYDPVPTERTQGTINFAFISMKNVIIQSNNITLYHLHYLVDHFIIWESPNVE